MTMVRPVLIPDHLAGPGWNMSLALLVLEKLRQGVTPTDVEWTSITDTAGFFASLASTPRDNFSPETTTYLRVLREKPDLKFFRRVSSELMKLYHERVATRFQIPPLQDAVFEVLEIVNRCRPSAQ